MFECGEIGFYIVIFGETGEINGILICCLLGVFSGNVIQHPFQKFHLFRNCGFMTVQHLCTT